MVNTKLLKGMIENKGTSVDEVAKRMGIDKSTLYRRISDGSTFTIGEVGKITEILQMSHAEAISIFFSQPVAQMRQAETVS